VAAERLFWRALEIRAGYRPAIDALEQLYRQGARWGDLAALWSTERTELGQGAGAAVTPEADRRRRAQLLDDLVAVHRDDLDGPARALVHADEACRQIPDDARAWV